MKIIDPHLHLFDLDQGEYSWLCARNAPFWPDKQLINRHFNEQDLQFDSPVDKPLEIVGFVHIEAGFDNQHPWRELQWLERTCHLPFKAIACVDITQAPEVFNQTLTKLQQQASLVGVRHILDDQALSILSAINTLTNLARLADAGLSFDCQLSLLDTLAIKQLINILSQLPQLICIINHAGFAPIAHNDDWSLWQENLSQLANFKTVAIKCSGWEMTQREYPIKHCLQVITSAIDLLGDTRVMLASNFPLCLFSKSYQRYWQEIVAITPPQYLENLSYKNALKWYKLSL